MRQGPPGCGWSVHRAGPVTTATCSHRPSEAADLDPTGGPQRSCLCLGRGRLGGAGGAGNDSRPPACCSSSLWECRRHGNLLSCQVRLGQEVSLLRGRLPQWCLLGKETPCLVTSLMGLCGPAPDAGCGRGQGEGAGGGPFSSQQGLLCPARHSCLQILFVNFFSSC